jgi:hypothetical protein
MLVTMSIRMSSPAVSLNGLQGECILQGDISGAFRKGEWWIGLAYRWNKNRQVEVQ